MNRILVMLIVMLLLMGCQNKITTFDEIIESDKVTIDGIKYDIMSVSEISYEYDDNRNIIKKSTNDNQKGQYSEYHIEYIYDNDVLIKEKIYLSNTLDSTIYYFYEGEKLIKKENLYENGLVLSTEYAYEGQTKKVTHINDDGEKTYYVEEIITGEDDVSICNFFDAKGNFTSNEKKIYENNQLISTVAESADGRLITQYYEYNNIGDKIFLYIVHHDKKPFMMVKLYEYEYNNDMLPINVTEYQVQSLILEENIRKY